MKKIIMAISTLLVSTVHAQEIAPIRLEMTAYTGSLSFVGDSSTMNVGSTAAYYFAPNVGAITTAAVVSETVNNKTVRLSSILGGLIVNAGDADIGNAFYLSASLGAVGVSSGTVSDVEMAYMFSAGKRFRLSDRVSYSPSATVLAVGSSDTAIEFDFARFSLFF